jgi:phospholipid/cholesterol/gamma-HCH transport system substrate-binding protein
LRIKTETRVGLFILVALAIFFYMTFHIGVFRLNVSSYSPYLINFKDVSGLAPKAPVKVAGVKVGWVEDIYLVEDDYDVQARVMIKKTCILRSDSSAIVRQDGVLGTKYLEIVPGDPLLPSLSAGATLGKPSRELVSIDELLYKFQSIANNVDDVTSALKDVFGSEENKKRLTDSMKNMDYAIERFAAVTESLDRTMANNETNINIILENFREFSVDAKDILPSLKGDISRVANRLDSDVFPAFQESMERISEVFDRDFNRVATKLEGTTFSLEEAAEQARDSFRSLHSVTQKIDDGKGLIGKLVNEEEAYHDIRVAARGLKNYFSTVDSMGIVIDSHFESMFRPAENFKYQDSKGYFGARIHPSPDYFYLIQLMGNLKGNIERKTSYRSWYDEDNRPIDYKTLSLSDGEKLYYAPRIDDLTVVRDKWKLGVQFGKIFKDIAVRAGLFEGTLGVGVDYDIPFKSDAFRWVTTLEAFDFRGRDRIDDSRPHLKWLNRLFVMRNIYFTFGADDFISKQNANAFFGVGLRFDDDDLKYVLSGIGGVG